jgi:AcrR family transcriptional regulator
MATTRASAAERARVGRPAKVTRDAIAKAALAVLDDAGLEALTMRRLADDLGVGTMTLYGHVASKDELLDLAIDAAVSDTPRPELTGSWRDQLRMLMESSWRRMARHPALVRIRVTRPVLRPEALRFGEAGVAVLRAAGFPPDEAAKAFRLLFTFTVGFAALSPERATAAARRDAERALTQLPADEYPNLTQIRPEFAAAMAGKEAFDYGLERILDGLERQLIALTTAPGP